MFFYWSIKFVDACAVQDQIGCVWNFWIYTRTTTSNEYTTVEFFHWVEFPSHVCCQTSSLQKFTCRCNPTWTSIFMIPKTLKNHLISVCVFSKRILTWIEWIRIFCWIFMSCQLLDVCKNLHMMYCVQEMYLECIENPSNPKWSNIPFVYWMSVLWIWICRMFCILNSVVCDAHVWPLKMTHWKFMHPDVKQYTTFSMNVFCFVLCVIASKVTRLKMHAFRNEAIYNISIEGIFHCNVKVSFCLMHWKFMHPEMKPYTICLLKRFSMHFMICI
jgi:hypothetical protein